ncbi:cuticle protein 19-like [Aricia agestis]|uniref:cuticle protein 19-like n=1 Tax=Aricia agestis TaxID=91739 RepID=UPI001C2080E7|nr:cuticle protein 19-like [Aricia agestis]
MFSKVLILCAVAAVCNAGYIHHAPAVSSSHNVIHHEVPTQYSVGHEGPAQYSVGHEGPAQYSVGHQAPLHTAAIHSAPVHAIPVVHAAPVAVHAAPAHHEDHYVDEHAYPKYDYSYSVGDPHTGDHKTQHESRDGDVVKGEYSLLQPDGSFRKVTYTADHHNGFNAVVHNSPPVIHHH